MKTGQKKDPAASYFRRRKANYRRRWGAYLLCSGWVQVFPPRHRHRIFFTLSIDLSKSPYTLFHNRSWQVADVFISSDQVLGRLVPVNSAHRCASISGLSTSSSLRGLTSFQNGRSHLGVGFVLRCFQRLSLPCLATRLYHWRDNRCTRGRSIPVLSY